MLTSCSAVQRYQWFLKRYPGIVDCINIKYITSFLGMTPETLSRARKAIADAEVKCYTIVATGVANKIY